MTQRVLLGSGRGTYGLFVSRPGYDVTSCDASYLLFDSTVNFGQVFVKGSMVWGSGESGTKTVYFTNTGATPYPLFSYQIGSYYSNSVVNLTVNVTNTYLSVYAPGLSVGFKLNFALLKVIA